MKTEGRRISGLIVSGTFFARNSAEEQGAGEQRRLISHPIAEAYVRKPIKSHTELRVYRQAFESAMKIFRISKSFPVEERYSLTDQVRKSSRSVCSNIAEAWRKRRYDAAFVAKLNDSEAEASETQTWIDFAVKCGYLDKNQGDSIRAEYDIILGQLVSMIRNPSPWLLKKA